jgi:N6-adenosine-specific RNA methylase IME4
MKKSTQPAAQAVTMVNAPMRRRAAVNQANALLTPVDQPRFEAHRVTQLFPRASEQVLQQLVESIRTQGQLQPIIVVRSKIIDGLGRLEACRLAGVQPVFEHRDDLSEEAIFQLAVALNVDRRHLDESQRAMVAAGIALYEVGANQHSTHGFSQAQAAQTMKVSVDTLQRAKKVLENGTPELHTAVTQGKLDVTNAAAISTLSPDAQKVILLSDEKAIRQAAKVINKKAKEKKRETQVATIQELRKKNVPLAKDGQKFELLLADPPWDYLGTFGTPYPTMSIQEICDMPIRSRSAANAILFLWVPASLVSEGMSVVNAWGFEFKTTAVWRKGESGLGSMFRVNHELLFIGTKGAVPASKEQPASCFDAPRTSKHSEKPQLVFDMIQRMYPELTKLELFCRGNPRQGWSGWGNECVGSIDMDMTSTAVESANDPKFEDLGDQLLNSLGMSGKGSDVPELKRG